jgi:hypothetical protein
VEYTKIDELKTNALHAAMLQHKRGDVSFTARAAADSDDEFGFGIRQETSSSSLDTYMASRGGSWHGAEGPTASSFSAAEARSPSSMRKQRQKHRRYVNVSNSQLTVVINQEKKSNGTVASTILGWAYWGGGADRGGPDREDASDFASFMLNATPLVQRLFPADDGEESEPEVYEEPAVEEQQASLVDEIDMLCAELDDDVCF